MPTSLGTMRTDLRNRINEPSSLFWTDAELNNWLNEGAKVVCRRGEVLQQFNPIPIMSGQQKVTVPTDFGPRIHRVEFVANNSPTLTYTLQPSNPYNMDQYWGPWQSQPRNFPGWFVLWGTPGVASVNTLQMQIYPPPSSPGVLNLWYYKLPIAMVADTDPCELPEGWSDLAVLYAEYTAKRKQHDPAWQESKQLFEEAMQSLVDKSRFWHDQGAQISMVGQPGWASFFGEWT